MLNECHMLSVTYKPFYAECRYADCRGALKILQYLEEFQNFVRQKMK